MYDTIIIGAGPAGLTAGIYAARREMKALIIGKEIGGQLIWASDIENYPGFKKIDNFDLINRMQEQVKALGVEIKNGEAQMIHKLPNGNFEICINKEKIISKTIIIAMGLSPRQLAVPGEKEFMGRGVSYCANCDGPFYKEKTVAVAGGGNAALDAAEVLSKIANKVYLIHRRREFRGFAALIKKVKSKTNIEFILDSEVKKIIGNNHKSDSVKLGAIKIFNNKTKKESELKIDGLFIEIGRIAHTDLVADLVKRDQQNQIIADEKCQTSQPGIFAAGDITQVPFKQITIACGQGTIAALSAYQYLQLQ